MHDDEAPLEDAAYEPVARPINGRPNPLVKKWGPRSQLRWFKRFWGSDAMPTLSTADANEYHCSSLEHKGGCCGSCIEDYEMGYDDLGEHCCCRALVERVVEAAKNA